MHSWRNVSTQGDIPRPYTFLLKVNGDATETPARRDPTAVMYFILKNSYHSKSQRRRVAELGRHKRKPKKFRRRVPIFCSEQEQKRWLCLLRERDLEAMRAAPWRFIYTREDIHMLGSMQNNGGRSTPQDQAEHSLTIPLNLHEDLSYYSSHLQLF